MSKNTFIVLVSALVIFMVALLVKADIEQTRLEELQNGEVELGGTWYLTEETTVKGYYPDDSVSPVAIKKEEPEKEIKHLEAGKDEYEGFVFYELPDEYKREGAKLQESYQKYLWKLCKKRKLNYYIVLALIERESGYDSSCVGDSGESVGYLQIQEKWHNGIMKELEVDSLYSPKGNLNVGTKLLQNIYKEYGKDGDNCVLMVYNMGSSRAKELWESGIYSTEYSRYVMKRAKKIEQELKQDKQDDKG